MKQRSALLLEDDTGIQELIETLMTHSGYSVTSCISPLDLNHSLTPCLAIDSNTGLCISDPCFDLIITDINMPHMSGLEFVKRLRQAECTTKHIAIMSGDWDDEKRLTAHKLDCTTFRKPFNLKDMRTWLNSREF